jgi:hypothetical protein
MLTFTLELGIGIDLLQYGNTYYLDGLEFVIGIQTQYHLAVTCTSQQLYMH